MTDEDEAQDWLDENKLEDDTKRKYGRMGYLAGCAKVRAELEEKHQTLVRLVDYDTKVLAKLTEENEAFRRAVTRMANAVSWDSHHQAVEEAQAVLAQYPRNVPSQCLPSKEVKKPKCWECKSLIEDSEWVEFQIQDIWRPMHTVCGHKTNDFAGSRIRQKTLRTTINRESK